MLAATEDTERNIIRPGPPSWSVLSSLLWMPYQLKRICVIHETHIDICQDVCWVNRSAPSAAVMICRYIWSQFSTGSLGIVGG